MSPAVKDILEHVASWPTEDQEELAELAREIEARRTGVYVATPDELRDLEAADRSALQARPRSKPLSNHSGGDEG